MKDNKNKKNKKRIFVSAVALAILGGALVNVVKFTTVSAWGPERQTYTNASPASQAVFNSITDNAGVGDERDFVRIVEISKDGTKNVYSNDVTIRGGYDYDVWIYFHNNASSTYNTVEQNYAGVARNVRVSAAFPSSLKAGEKGQVDAYITSNRTLVDKVWDEAYITAAENVNLAYVAGSAKILNQGAANGTVLSTDLFTEAGTLIGYNTLNGIVYGCDEYAGQVVYTIRATTVVEPSSTFEIDKKVSTDGGANWNDDTALKPETEAEFRITYKNTGTLLQAVTAFDTLENGVGMEYVAGSTRIVANGTEMIVRDENGGKLFNGGVEVGEIKPGETAEIYYKVKIKSAESFTSCAKTVLYNLAGVSAKATGEGVGANTGVATLHDKVRIEVDNTGNGCGGGVIPTILPNTGPAEWILAGVMGTGLVMGIIYYISSKRTLKRLQEQTKGNEP
ncbi:LPXTG cell wall anchor domain-containing protein [Candidatus Saccharibacteria bacterium]|nr:LPXTG cell wall anchor domain-containing protein [Candidatus Saccharibacteria bacterium]